MRCVKLFMSMPSKKRSGRASPAAGKAASARQMGGGDRQGAGTNTQTRRAQRAGGDNRRSASAATAGHRAHSRDDGARGQVDLGPNARLICQPRAREALATPALVLDLAAFEHNLRAMARLCKKAGMALR